ncbi:hypothetical protein [Coxiella-like endosymbiont of Rhipicephalus sanguineus]|uniref:hypothetical protein n=1 Tax=Coxiella-like endosymbiont of Rhipicephalus sanguineus TaxID=1955402 RepID=UPI00203CBF09|nr:hypothetical protein [Coxiella-like endosymbiont of Rhipicephalus sanguineus]
MSAVQKKLKWLKEILPQAVLQRQWVWLVFHIPFGIDVYKTLTSGKTTFLWW